MGSNETAHIYQIRHDQSSGAVCFLFEQQKIRKAFHRFKGPSFSKATLKKCCVTNYGAPFAPKFDLCIRYSTGCILCYLTQCDIQLR